MVSGIRLFGFAVKDIRATSISLVMEQVLLLFSKHYIHKTLFFHFICSVFRSCFGAIALFVADFRRHASK
jgi:hypothetical protein